MTLSILHPEVAWRDCESCQKFVYDEDTGQIVIGRDRQPERRAPGCLAPCRYRRGCPKGTPEAQLTLTSQNQQAWDHYRECRAVGEFPDDAIVRRHAALLHNVEESCKRKQELDRLLNVLQVLRR